MNDHPSSENFIQYRVEEHSSIGTPWIGIIVAIFESSELDKEDLHHVDRVVDEIRDVSQELFKHSDLQIMCIGKLSTGNSQCYVDCNKTKNTRYFERTRYKVIRIAAIDWKTFRLLTRSIYSVHMLGQLLFKPCLDFTKKTFRIGSYSALADWPSQLHANFFENLGSDQLLTDANIGISDEEPSSPSTTTRTAPALQNMCPFTNNDIASIKCDHNGGVMTSIENGIKITIPKGAIGDGSLVTISIAAGLYGPFVLPSNCRNGLISPIFWICAPYHFQKAVEVEFEHYGACDPSHYQLLSCEDDDESLTMRPIDYDLEFTLRDDSIKLCTFQTRHFCSYCLYCSCHEPTSLSICASFLKPESILFNHFSVEIWFSFPIIHCLKRNAELYKKRGMKLAAQFMFEAPCHKCSKNYFQLDYDKNSDGWHLCHLLSEKIYTDEINFYNWFDNADDLRTNEELSLFPPRFILDVKQVSEATKDLYTDIKVTLYDENVPTLSTPFFLCVSKFEATDERVSEAAPLPLTPQHHSDENKSKLIELTKYSEKVSSKWQNLAIQLGIPTSVISRIDQDHSHVEKKCHEMFDYWLINMEQPRWWCHFIQALYNVGLDEVAEEAKQKHLDVNEQLKEPCGSDHSSATSLIPNLKQLIRLLRRVPNTHLNDFIVHLLPKDSAKELIQYIEYTDQSKDLNIEKICQAFLKEENPSWIEVQKALIEAECGDLADIVEACFLPM